MAKNESLLKSRLMAEFKRTLPAFIGLRHEDIRTSGIPDISLTGNGQTSWIEIKHATPNFLSKGIQELTMQQLAGAGFARYVIYWERPLGDGQRTLILHPRHVIGKKGRTANIEIEVESVGHNHQFVVSYFSQVHHV